MIEVAVAVVLLVPSGVSVIVKKDATDEQETSASSSSLSGPVLQTR